MVFYDQIKVLVKNELFKLFLYPRIGQLIQVDVV